MHEAPDPPYGPGVTAIFDVVRRLRAPDGCPWDREQTHRSLRPYLLEETYEALEALDRGDDTALREELGDVLLQVAMHAAIAEEEGRFTGAEVSEGAAAKMVSRHPHVFGDRSVADAEDVLRNWETDKAKAAAAAGSTATPLDRVPVTLPALAWAHGMQKRAARVGFDFADPRAAAEAVAEEARELAATDSDDARFTEIGDLLFAVVGLARKLKVNPEDALRESGQRFRERFRVMDATIRASGRSVRDLTSTELEEAWSSTAG